MPHTIIVLLLVTQYQAEYSRDFRRQGFDDQELRMVGTVGKLTIKPEPKGLRITLPRQQNELRPIGFIPQFRVSGDFEITTTYEIIQQDTPTSGDGVGVSLYLVMDSSTNEAAHLGRSARVGGAQVISTARLSTVGGSRKILRSQSFPTTATAGKLRCTRTGSTLHYWVAEQDSNDFQEVGQDELGTGDLTMVRVAAETGSSPHALDVRFLDFQVRADELPGPSSARPPSQSLSPGWLIGLGLGLGLMGSVVLACKGRLWGVTRTS